MTAARVLAMVVPALPVFAQYAGPAVLSRGDAPSALSNLHIKFRPYLGVTASYDTALTEASEKGTGGIANGSSSATALNWGIEGSHRWKHTQVGLDYRGNFARYWKTRFSPAIDESLLLSVTRQLTPHIFFSLRENSGIASRPLVRTGLQQSVPFDPSTTNIPTTDYFDNRTYFTSSQAALTIQKSARLSMNMGGDAFLTRRRAPLRGTTVIAAHGDVQHRLTRRTTVGTSYTFSNFRFTRVFGETDVHGIAVTFATALSARMEFSGFAGINRAEAQFLQAVPVDPVITALLGITSGSRVTDLILYGPLYAARLSRTFARGVAYLSVGRSFTPGNGLFLTSQMTTAMAGYNYTGVRRWGLGANVSYNHGEAYGPITGGYNTLGGGVNASRTITRGLHMVSSYSVRQYSSPSYANYNRLIHVVAAGLTFSPGDVPLHLW